MEEASENYDSEVSENFIRIKVSTATILTMYNVSGSWYPSLTVHGEDFDINEIYQGFAEDDDYTGFLKWVADNHAEAADEDGFIDEDNSGMRNLDDVRLPEKFIPERKLLVYTWGKALRSRAPNDSQANFNACLLTGKRKGINLKKYNGLSEDVQKAVISCTRFTGFIEQIIKKIEKDDLNIISVNCSKGRHRSVTVGEVLKKYFYKQAVVNHLEIKKITR